MNKDIEKTTSTNKGGKRMSTLQIKTPLDQLCDQIVDVIWNVYRESDENAEGGAVEYRMARVKKLIVEYAGVNTNDRK